MPVICVPKSWKVRESRDDIANPVEGAIDRSECLEEWDERAGDNALIEVEDLIEISEDGCKL